MGRAGDVEVRWRYNAPRDTIGSGAKRSPAEAGLRAVDRQARWAARDHGLYGRVYANLAKRLAEQRPSADPLPSCLRCANDSVLPRLPEHSHDETMDSHWMVVEILDAGVPSA